MLDINGIFNDRFDLVLTNPPFGSNVGADQKVGASEEIVSFADRLSAERDKQRRAFQRAPASETLCTMRRQRYWRPMAEQTTEQV